jgi:putative membrane protein insertion efficiency factor
MKRILIALVRVYQVATTNFAPRCKYYPSCSNYAITAVGRYGVKGIAMAAGRIVRCNPWSQGGVDYVDAHLDCADVKNLLSNHKKEVVGAN